MLICIKSALGRSSNIIFYDTIFFRSHVPLSPSAQKFLEEHIKYEITFKKSTDGIHFHKVWWSWPSNPFMSPDFQSSYILLNSSQKQ